MVRSQAEHCSILVRKAMAFLRDQENNFTIICLNDVVNSCIEVATPLLARKGMTLTSELSPDISLIHGDLVLLRQALLNLIVNASQAMENKTGQPQIHIKSWMEGEDIFVSVKDTGPGVPPNMELRIFEAFYTTKGKNGNGIGLAAVSDIMSRHNGEITLEQNDDCGACFKMRFPAR